MTKLGYTLLYTGENGKSYFKDVTVDTPLETPLGKFSEGFSVTKMYFRDSLPSTLDWQPALQKLFVVYVTGTARVEVSSGEVRDFGPGDILYTTDVTGDGHRTTILTEGVALIITQAD